MKVLKLILMLLWIMFIGVAINVKEYQGAAITTGMLLLAILIFKRKKRGSKNKKKKGNLCAYIKHVVGLPLAENAMCVVTYLEDAINIQSGNSIFNLPLEKVTDMATTTDVDIQKQYVSSAGGAVGGLILFGPLGAMVGGRAKKKESKKVTNYFIITYKDNDEIKYISFNSTGSFKVYKFIGRFKSREQEAVVVNL